jgi:TonB-dependent receptor
VPGSITTYPGTLDASSATFANAGVSTYGSFRSFVDVNRQLALNGKWSPGKLTLTGDLSYTKATEVLVNPAFVMNATAPTLTQISSLGGAEQTLVSGIDLTKLASYSSAYTYDTENRFKGNEKAYRFDGDYALGSGFFSSLSAGIRYADRSLEFVRLSYFGTTTAAAMQANPQFFGLIPGTLFSKTENNAVQPAFLTLNPDQLRYNLTGLSQALGTGVTGPTVQPTQNYSADEKNYSTYFRANFEADVGVPMDGNIGVRVVKVEEFLNGIGGNAKNGYIPVKLSTSHTNALPSLNLRFKLRDDLQLRFAASKVVSYPDFSQLSPVYTLLFAQQSATGGNPNLKPTRANQFDGSLEWYFAPASSVFATLFYKKVQDFVVQQTVANAITINGVTYNLTGPQNGASGTIKGAEVGYQQFFDFLPGLWSGLGAQINYTYVDSIAPSAVLGSTTTLPGLSRNAFNLIGIYEKGPFSFRLAYAWRSQFYSSIYTGGNAQLFNNPIFTHQFGWLDGSFTYDVTDQWSAYVQGSNLLRTRMQTFFGRETIPAARTIDDRQYLVGFRFKF